MGYETWLEGTLSLDPFPDERTALALREALATFEEPRAGRFVLTPLGRGLVCEGATDWEVALQALQRARATLFEPSGVDVSGTLHALGEDDAHLATISIKGEQVSIERHDLEGEDEDDVPDLLLALHADNHELRAHAAMVLGGRDAPGVAQALAAAARGDAVEGVRCKALESLGSLGGNASTTIGDIMVCLHDASPFVWYWATFALGRLGVTSAEVVSELEKLTSDSADGPRFGALDALRRIRGTAR